MSINVTLISLIYHILSTNDKTRDDWMLCIKEVHSLEMISNRLSKEEYFDNLFYKDDSGEYSCFSNVHTIKRLWQKVQEEYPHLRGLTWEERQRQGGQYNIEKEIDGQLYLFTQEQLDEFAKIGLKKFMENK